MTILRVTSAALCIALASPAFGQSATAPTPLPGASAAAATSATDTSEGIAEIVVTAQKREERLSDVPITVNASTADQLRSAGIVDVQQLGRISPSFTSSASVFGYQVFSIRGVNFNTQQASAPPAVAVYVDQAPLPYSAMTGGMMLDVERVEVLKGPQGTLFGQNATGGLVNVIAAKPTHELHAGLDVDVNSFGQTTLDGFVSGPISDTLRARFAASTTQLGAWQKGYYLYDGKNGDQNKAAARLLLDWTPDDRLTVALNLTGNYDHGEAIQPQLGLVSGGTPANYVPGLAGYPVASNDRDVELPPGFNTHAHNNMGQASLRADYQFTDASTFTSLTNFVSYSQSGTNFNYPAIALPNAYTTAFAHIRSISQELRLSGSWGDSKAVQYVAGANYSKDTINEGAFEAFNGLSSLPIGTNLKYDNDLGARASAVFGNLDFRVTPRLTLSGGLRSTWTKQSISGCTNDGGSGIWGIIFGGLSAAVRGLQGLGPVPAGDFGPGGCATLNDSVPNVMNPNPAGPALIPDFLPIAAGREQKENNVSWRGSASFKLNDDNMLYASVSRGFKAGVFPAQPNIFFSAGGPVKQEKLTSYEVGAKLALLDRKARLDLSAFHYDYRNKQFYTYIPIPTVNTLTSTIINIPKSKVDGLDADLTVKPISQLTLHAAATYIKTKVTNLGDQTVYSGVTFEPFDPTGKAFNYAPSWSATFDAEYRTNVSEKLDAVMALGGQYYSKSYSDLGEQEALANPSYYTLDVSAGLEYSERLRVRLWARNLTDRYYWSSIFRAGDVLSKFAGMPRTYGISVGYNF